MKFWIVILILILLSANPASAVAPNPDDPNWWAPAVSGTLYKGNTLSNGEYMVKAVQFPAGVPGHQDINGNVKPETEVEGMVYLEVYRSGTLIKEVILKTGGYYNDPDNEVKVSVTGLPASMAQEWVLEYYKPWATVSVQLRAKPKFEVTISTVEEKTTYTSNTDIIITAKVTVKNSGDGYARNVDVNLNAGDLKLRSSDTSQLHRNYYEMDKGVSMSYEVVLLVPNLIDEKSYTLSASAKGQDTKDLFYDGTGSLSITVSPQQNYFGITKAVRKRIYLQDIAVVVVTIANGGMYDIHDISISDNMSENFELKSGFPFPRNVSLLKPGQEESYQYSIKALEANIDGFTIPAASATFIVNNKRYSASSETNKIVVNGPKILLNKTVNKPVVNISEEVTVTVSINNVGDIGSKIDVEDYLPEGVSLVSGMTSMENYSEPATPMGFSYIIRMNYEGKYELPSAVANYTDVKFRGTTRGVKSSDRPVITVVDPSKITPTPTPNGTGAPGGNGNPSQTSGDPANTANAPTPTPITPGFDIVLTVTVLVFAAAKRRR